LEEGIGGMVHISDLSWTKKFHHPNEFTSIGETLDLIVLEIDQESRKLSLGHKQLEENPWDTFEQTFPVNSVHKATIIKRDDKGAVVQLPYGLEAYAPGKHLKAQDDKKYDVDDTLDVMIIEFDANSKRVIVSHSKTWEEESSDAGAPADNNQQQRAARPKKPNNKGIKKVQEKLEKTTLGDIDELAALKDKLSAAESDDTPADEPADDAE
jgi:small subunit ribosomal protein S1